MSNIYGNLVGIKKDIYIIKNDINDMVYIGQTKNVKSRFQSHCKPSSAVTGELISKAILEFGKEHFVCEVLESQVENYDEREKYWIQKYNSIFPNGYNISSGGSNPPNAKGSDCAMAILSDDMVEALTEDLRNTDLSMVALAEKYGFNSNVSVCDFNEGKTYKRDIEYPIRKDAHNGKLSSKDADEIIHLLKTTYLSFEEIGKRYNVEARAISRINKGIFHKRDAEEYPIRNGKITSTPPSLTYDQVTEVIQLLQTTNLSLREIARRFDVEYRTILEIKNGTRKIYRRKDLTYPLRPNV